MLFFLFSFIKFKFSKIPPNSDFGKEIVRLWDEHWRQNVLMDVSQIRESISTQAKSKREKQSFFRTSVGDLTKVQRTEWKNYVKINGLGLASIKTSALGKLIRQTGLPRKHRGNTSQRHQFFFFINIF